jgi:hypothetical protein
MINQPAIPTIGRGNGVSMGGYDYGVATLKYYYISAGSKDPLNSYVSPQPTWSVHVAQRGPYSSAKRTLYICRKRPSNYPNI